MSKGLLKLISSVLCLTVLATSGALVSSAQSSEEKNYKITSPYDTVDWDAWQAYKAQLHTHTNASDGYLTVKEHVQMSYDLGYDIVAITDHGTLNRGWNKSSQLVPLVRLIKYERTKLAPIVPLTDEEYNGYINGTAKTTNGTVRKNGMLDVPLGIEQNMATPITDCHLTSYFAEYGQGYAGVFGDYETPSAEVAKLGGLTMLSHVGEYVYIDKDSEKYVGQPVDDYYANKFARIFLDHPGSSVGMGINSATDEHTRCDRILYDQVLAKTIPNGVTPWSFSFADSHSASVMDIAFTMHMMPALTMEDFRTSMVNGTIFSVCRYSNGYELNGMKELPEDYETDVSLATPMVTKLRVNEQENTISVEGENFNQITWVSNGQVIARGGQECTTLDLNDYEDDVSLYVRFYITGEGGICYAQPITVQELDENGNAVAFEEVDVPETHDISTLLRKFVMMLDTLLFKQSIVVKIFKKIALGY